MARKLEFNESLNIVQAAIREAGGSGEFPASFSLGEILPTKELRQIFRSRIRNRVQAAGFEINPEDIPSGSQHTVNHIATMVAELAGDPRTADDT